MFQRDRFSTFERHVNDQWKYHVVYLYRGTNCANTKVFDTVEERHAWVQANMQGFTFFEKD
jgi:hypothetical protein